MSFTTMPASELRTAQQLLTNARSTVGASIARIHALNEETLDSQMRIAAISAPTGNESSRAAAIASALTVAGCATQLDAAGNVIAQRIDAAYEASVAPIVCMAHLDTVFDADTELAIVKHGTRIS